MKSENMLSSQMPSTHLSATMINRSVTMMHSNTNLRSPRSSVAWCNTPTVYSFSTEESEDEVKSEKLFFKRIPQGVLRLIFCFVESTRDLRACCIVSKSWREVIGSPQGSIGKRVRNSWEPYAGVWWIPRNMYSVLVVDMKTYDQRRPSAVGYELIKIIREKPSLIGDEYDITIVVEPRTVAIRLFPCVASIKWHRPLGCGPGPRTGSQQTTSAFDCSAVIELTPASNPLPGRPVPRQLYLSANGGTLKTFPDSHLRRPKSKSTWHSVDAALSELRTMFERSDWVALKDYRSHQTHRTMYY